MTLTGAEIALCVVIPLLVTSLVLLFICYCSNKQVLCFGKSEDQALLSISSHKSSTNHHHGNAAAAAVMSSASDDKKVKTKTLNENSYVSLSIVNPSYTEMRPVGHVHSATATTITPLQRHNRMTSPPQRHRPPSPPTSRSASSTALNQLTILTETSGGKKAAASLLPASPNPATHPMIPATTGTVVSPNRKVSTTDTSKTEECSVLSSTGYLSLGDNSSDEKSRSSSMEILNPENGKNMLFPGNRRRSSMQVPIDIRSIDPKLYGMIKPASFETDGIDDATKPILHISVRYRCDNEELVIKLIQARNLEAGDGNPIANPYCSIELMPDYVIHRSKIHQGTHNPEFEETFRFPLLQEEIDDKTLRIKVFDSDQFARDECAGVMDLKLKEIDFELNSSSAIDMWRTVPPIATNTSSSDTSAKLARHIGDLMIAFSYLPSAEKLTITIQKARNLNLVDGKKCDVFVKVSLYRNGSRLKKKKTNTISATSMTSCSPVFDEALTFNISHHHLKSRDVKLMCQVMHDAKLGNKSMIGWLELSQASGSCEERQHWTELISGPVNTPVARWHPLRRHNDTSSSSDS